MPAPIRMLRGCTAMSKKGRRNPEVCGRPITTKYGTCGWHAPGAAAKKGATTAEMRARRRQEIAEEQVAIAADPVTVVDARCLGCEVWMDAPDDDLCQRCSWKVLRKLAPLDFFDLVGPAIALVKDSRIVALAIASSSETVGHRAGQHSLIVSLTTEAAMLGIRRLGAGTLTAEG